MMNVCLVCGQYHYITSEFTCPVNPIEAARRRADAFPYDPDETPDDDEEREPEGGAERRAS